MVGRAASIAAIAIDFVGTSSGGDKPRELRIRRCVVGGAGWGCTASLAR